MNAPASDRRLRRWLQKDPARLERYLFEYPEETNRLDALTTIEPALHDQLGAAYQISPESLDLLRDRVKAPSNRHAAQLMGDLLRGTLTTAAILFTDLDDKDRT